MGELEKKAVIKQMFQQYDQDMMGELVESQLREMYTDIRLGGLSIQQIRAAMAYVCAEDACVESELFDLLQEMDRRHFLVQDFRWEFSMLDISNTDTVSEEQAKWFVQTVHGQYFSQHRWERFLRQRAVPGSGVSFAEIEVILCSIPSKEEWLDEQMEDRKEKREREKKLQQMAMVLEEEKRRRKREREAERRRLEKQEQIRMQEEDKRRKEEEDERLQRQREREEAERRRRKLQEEEDKKLHEDEEKERKRREEEEERRRKEVQRLQELAEKQRQDEEARRTKELEEAKYCELMLEDAVRGEKQANTEADDHQKRAKETKDAALKREAEESERRARLRAKEFRNKRIRYNLKVAIKRRDRERLPPAVDEFKKAKLPDDDMDLEKAERLLKEWQARDGLKLAMSRRQLAELEKAINFIKKHGFDYLLTQELIEAHKILLQLRRLERIRAEILELKQSTVAEIKSYQKPPPVVHTVMTGTFLVLGNKERETKDWKNIQILVGKTGKEGLKRRCLELEPGGIRKDMAGRAKELLGQFELDDVRDVSAGAATFFVWSWTMIEELEAQIEAKKQAAEEKQKEAERKRLEAEEMQRRKEEEGKDEEDGEGKKPETEAEAEQKTDAVGDGEATGSTTPDHGQEQQKKKSKDDKDKKLSTADAVQQKIKEANKMAHRKVERVEVKEVVETKLMRK